MKKLKKGKNAVIFGVCDGLGNYFKVDPILFRIAFVVLPSGLLIYFLLAALMPKADF